MTEPMMGQLMMFGGTFNPRNWAYCDGQLLAISSNNALFSLFGDNYGGDGRTTFGLPDLRGRVPLGMGTGPGLTHKNIGDKYGYETTTLNEKQMPSHTHQMSGEALQGSITATLKATSDEAVTNNPGGGVLALAGSNTKVYKRTSAASTDMNSAAISVTHDLSVSGSIAPAGGSMAHDNMQPWACLNFIVALQGYYPSRD